MRTSRVARRAARPARPACCSAVEVGALFLWLSCHCPMCACVWEQRAACIRDLGLPACLRDLGLPACLHACMHACTPTCKPACMPASCTHACVPNVPLPPAALKAGGGDACFGPDGLCSCSSLDFPFSQVGKGVRGAGNDATTGNKSTAGKEEGGEGIGLPHAVLTCMCLVWAYCLLRYRLGAHAALCSLSNATH